MKNITLLEPIGFCAGVTHTLNLIEQSKEKYAGKDIYIYGAPVHNKTVLKRLSSEGFKLLDNTGDYLSDLKVLKEGDVLILPAHGHLKEINVFLKDKGIIAVDAICPVLAKTHKDILKALKDKESDIIFVGDKKHDETKAILSLNNKIIHFEDIDANNHKDNALVFSQSTYLTSSLKMALKDIRKVYSNVKVMKQNCVSVKQRQRNLFSINPNAELIIVVGDKTSANTSNLYRKILELYPRIKTLFVTNKEELGMYYIDNAINAVITSGTSTPIEDVQEIVEYLKTI